MGKNWLVRSFNLGDGTDLSDTEGPWVKDDGGVVSIKQLTNVFTTDEFNGSDYYDEYLVKVTWIYNDLPYYAFYTIDDTISPDTIKTSESRGSPIFGEAVPATLATGDYSNIKVYIYKSQKQALLHTPLGATIQPIYNDTNTLYFSTSPIGTVPVGQYSHLLFDENSYDSTSSSWVSNNGKLKIRGYITTLNTGDTCDVYVNPWNASKLFFKAASEIFTLSENNITIRFL